MHLRAHSEKQEGKLNEHEEQSNEYSTLETHQLRPNLNI